MEIVKYNNIFEGAKLRWRLTGEGERSNERVCCRRRRGKEEEKGLFSASQSQN